MGRGGAALADGPESGAKAIALRPLSSLIALGASPNAQLSQTRLELSGSAGVGSRCGAGAGSRLDDDDAGAVCHGSRALEPLLLEPVAGQWPAHSPPRIAVNSPLLLCPDRLLCATAMRSRPDGECASCTLVRCCGVSFPSSSALASILLCFGLRIVSCGDVRECFCVGVRELWRRSGSGRWTTLLW